jgi:ABC-type multidrug transport system fused ATPase/permease subunit
MKSGDKIENLFKLVNKLLRHLSGRRKRQLVLLLCLMLVSAFAEVISLGAVIPFLGILISPEKLISHPLISDKVTLLGISSPEQLILPLTIAFITTALLAGATRILFLWASIRLAFACGADLGIEVYRRTLYQPYSVHVARNSSEVISGMNKVNNVVFGIIMPVLTLISSSVLLMAITIALFAIDTLVASLAILGFGSTYLIITLVTRRRLKNNSHRIAIEQTQVVKSIQEGLGGIRDVLLDGAQPIYCDIYRQADIPLRKAQSNNAFIGLSPRYIMESVGMALIALLAYWLSTQSGGIAEALPLLGALALGAQRLLPALQQIYYAWTDMAGNQATLNDTILLLEQPLSTIEIQASHPPLAVHNEIRLENIHFRYNKDSQWVINGINLSIPKGARVGFVGSTGSGKSTALDIVMGLLLPSKGRLLVDGKDISGESINSWQRSVAHVPQFIYLADATIAENIAFGVPMAEIDLKRLHLAASQAQIADFIENSPEGYQSHVGERGIRLSGGQRQRIGIARALYKQASVLVLDEATSALDNSTERLVMDAFNGIMKEKTILVIAHRLSTVQACDFIVELAEGKIVAQGTYEELLKLSPSFKKMAILV